jgi:hypothetical protein
MVAEIWEGHSTWFGQMVDEYDGWRDRTIFVASSRGSVIAQITVRVPLSHLVFRDRLNPTFR